MTSNNALLALAFLVTLPAAALAQPPAWAMTGKADCCVTTVDDGAALAASVLLPPDLTLPADERATALAASVLLPPVEQHAHSAAAMSCCGQPAPSAPTRGAGGCCGDMTHASSHPGMAGGCDMPCCQAAAPAEPPER